jgi:hypothetical protein
LERTVDHYALRPVFTPLRISCGPTRSEGDSSVVLRSCVLGEGMIYNWVYLHTIPFVKLGRALRFNPEEIERVVGSSSTLEVAGRR